MAPVGMTAADMTAADVVRAGASGTLSSCDPVRVEQVRKQLDDRVGLLSAQIHALSAELVDTLADVDAVDGWQGDGFRTMGHWLSIRAKFSLTDARRIAAVAERRDALPTLMEHARDGRLSVGVMAGAARVVTPENEVAIADLAVICTPTQTARVLSKYRDAQAANPAPHPQEHRPSDDASSGSTPSGGPPPDDLPTWWNSWYDDAGRGRIDAALDPSVAALLEQAWAAASAAGEADDAGRHGSATHGQDAATDRTDSADRHDAVTDGVDQDDHSACEQLERRRRHDVNDIVERLASTMLDHASDQGLRAPGGERFGVLVHIDVKTLAGVLGMDWDPTLPTQLGSQCFDARTGRHLSEQEVARILCDANLQLLVHQDGVPLWMSNELRSANRQQRRALRFRAGGRGGCEFPGCPQTRFLDAHHVRHHACGGCTDPANLVLLCSWHHRQVHDRGWQIVTEGDQRFTFRDRDGACLGTTSTNTHPGGPPPDLARLPGIDRPPDPPPRLHADTPRSDTHGEPLTAYALDVFVERLLNAA